MADVVAGGPAIEFWIPEVLVVIEARDVIGGKIAALRRDALAQRVVQFPRVAIREALAHGALQPVVDHRLAAVDVVAAGRADRRVGPRSGLPVERLRELTLQRE